MSQLLQAGQRGTILVVDDEQDILTAVEDLFEEEFRVLATTQPEEALAILAVERDVAVIISDQRMPGLTGEEFLARARELTDAEGILLTGYADLSAVVGALNRSRIVGYVPKPWDSDTLRSMVASAFGRWELGRALLLERSLLTGLLNHVEAAVSFKDSIGRIVRLNGAKASKLGVSVAEALGREESEFLTPEAAGQLANFEAEVIDIGKPTEETIETRQGAAVTWTQVQRVPLFDAAGDLHHLVTIEQDVSERKQIEGRMRQADKMQALGTLAGGVAHDFNNLLTAIIGSLDLAMGRMPPDPKLERLLNNANTAAKRGASLTHRLLSFSRRHDVRSEVTDVNGLIGAMDGLLQPTLGPTIRIEHDHQPGTWCAEIDPDQLELAVLNLCVNARDAMPNGGTITLRTRCESLEEQSALALPPGDYVVVSVIDNGAGIPPEIQSRVFEPFFTTKDVGKGTGLGLSMVYGLAQQVGGAVSLCSEMGKGTAIHIYLPRCDKPATAKVEAKTAVPEGRRARVLIVDDDPTVRAVLAAYVSDLGHEMIEATDGPSALTVLQRLPIDLMIADVVMPGMSGTELARTAEERYPDLQILLVTGYEGTAEVPAHLPVLRKPFQREDIARQLAEVFAGNPA
ncbi:response regulator [Lacibacterium aquatile]|uniref:histidine kinase n=1 Tax=Lacibacterium aquatile TaxID=1168082 RepID=A0ABW5DR53_9PROT